MRISPLLTPVAEKLAPVTPTFAICTLALPVFVKATLSELVIPTLTLPKLKFVVLKPSDFDEVTPVPVKLMTSGEFGAVLTKEMDPAAGPAITGEKTALNIALELAAIVNGALIPEMPNPVPETLTDETETVLEPPFDKVMVWELLVPVETFPKAAFDGIAESCGWVAMPLSAMFSGEFGALLVIEMLPVSLPPTVGAKRTVKVALCPAVRVLGVIKPLILNPVPVAVACEIARLAVPLLVKVMVWELFPPVATEPKVTTEGLAPICPCTPVPDSKTAVGEPAALLTTEMLPDAGPVVVGANVALNVELAPGAMVKGRAAAAL